jgi:RNA polymerase sigma factor (sigma-70 family)
MPISFEQNILPVRQKLYRFALSLTGSAQDAEDIVQDVLEKIWLQNGLNDSEERLEKVANWEAWCMTLTRNQSIDKQRANAVRRSESVDDYQQTSDSELLPDAQTEQNDILQQVKAKMNMLPDKQRSVMHLRDVEEMSYEEIAEILGISLDQVKVNLHRARKTLREQLLDHNPFR